MYQPYMPMLAKLFILSSVVHQVCFSLFSSLPYAVGQVRRRPTPQTCPPKHPLAMMQLSDFPLHPLAHQRQPSQSGVATVGSKSDEDPGVPSQ